MSGGLKFKNGAIVAPDVYAVEKETKFETFHGNIKEVTLSERATLLDDVELSDGSVSFRSGDYCLEAVITETEKGIHLSFNSENDCQWRFVLPPEEDVYGGGERFGSLSLMGCTVANLVTEHIITKTLVEKTFKPRRAYKIKDNSYIGTYVPMPLFVTKSKKLIVFSCRAGGKSTFDEESCRFEFDALPDSLLLEKHETFRDISRSIAEAYSNRQYIPAWCHEGLILGVQGGTERVRDIAEKTLEAGVPLSAVWCQDWCGDNQTIMGSQVRWNFEADSSRYHDLEGLIKELAGRGVRFLAYLNPYLLKDGPMYNDCRDRGWLITHRDGSVYHIKSTTFDAGMLDLTNPEVQTFVKEVLIKKNMLEKGIKGWMSDFGEYLPMDCVIHSGTPELLHNQWPVLWAGLNREAVEEYGDKDVFFFSRSGYLGIQSYTPVLWNGDQHTDLYQDYGMPSVIPASLSAGMSGITLSHFDIGGFFSFMRIKRDREMLVRWMEMSAVSPMMRSHESLRPGKNAQPYDEDVLPYTKKLVRLHTALRPYIEHVVSEAREGIPAMRPLFYDGDYAGEYDIDKAYFLGDDLIMFPVLEKGVTELTVDLPEGSWRRLGTNEDYTSGKHTVAAPLGSPAVFWRADSAFEDTFGGYVDGELHNKKIIS